MLHKTFDLIEAKADDTGVGTFTALASVFGNVDHVNDRVMPGAFKKTLDGWRKSGRPMPVILAHQWDDLFAVIGKADPRAVMETDQGLRVQGQLDLENPKAKQAHKLMKEGLLTGWSFGYTVPDGGERLNKDDGANELTEIDLVEVGPCLKGANSEAQLQSVKSALRENEKVALKAVGEMVKPLEAEAEVAEAPPEVEEPEEPPAEITAEVDENLPAPEKVENVESEKSVTPAKPAAKDPLKNEIDRTLIEIALGR